MPLTHNGEGEEIIYSLVRKAEVSEDTLQVQRPIVNTSVIPNETFTLDGSAERAEKTTSYTFTVALEPGQDTLGYVLYVPEAE